MGSFARGSELWMHQARLFVVAIGTVVLLSVLVGLGVTSGYFWNTTTASEKYALERNVLAHTRDVLGMTAGKMELHVEGRLRLLEVVQVASLTEELAEEGWRKLRNGGLFGALSAAGFVFLVSLYWWGYGRAKMQDRQLRGARLVAGPELATLVRQREEASPYELAGVPMRLKSETLHTLLAGAQGTGKSQQFFALMKQVRARGKRMIVYDPTGEFTQAFYREGQDILMNPLDARSPNWNVWQEIAKDYHYDNIANGLIPDPAGSDPFWAHAGRMLLKDVIAVLGKKGKRSNRELYNAIAKMKLEDLHKLLQGTAGASYVDPTTERTGMSLKMTVQNQLESFRFLPDEGEPFSIRKWIHEEGDSWMFITARESMREALKPVLSLWIDTAIKAVLDLEPVHRERLWFCIDELPTLQKLDILKLALTNTRKYGLCMVLGVQDFSQLYEIYGHDLAKTIISGCQTKLLLRVTDGAAAKLLADLMGQAEVDEKEETLSYGLSPERDGVSVFARRSMRDLVLSSEILTLPDMTGYLVIPGDYPIARVRYDYVPTGKQAEGFVERDGFSISFAAAVPAASAPAAASGQPAQMPQVSIQPVPLSHAKVGPEQEPGIGSTRPNPLADAL
jgi:type IV conjugative transfer system coupling protein TraD